MIARVAIRALMAAALLGAALQSPVVAAEPIGVSDSLRPWPLRPPLASLGPAYNQPCADPNKLAIDTAGTRYVCNGVIWDSAPDLAAGVHADGTACRQDGITAASADSYLVVCRNGTWVQP